MPFPTTRVIHEDWEALHRPVAAGAMTAVCTVTTGGAGGWDPDTGPSPGTPTTVHTGPCRVQALNSGANAADAAGQLVIERPYLVAVAADAPEIPARARVHVDECVGDPHLVGKVLTVVDPKYGSLRFERDLLCNLDLTNQEG